MGLEEAATAMTLACAEYVVHTSCHVCGGVSEAAMCAVPS